MRLSRASIIDSYESTNLNQTDDISVILKIPTYTKMY